MSFNPFTSVGDYPGMLNKIASYTFFVALLLCFLIRAEVRQVDQALAKLTLPVPLMAGVNLPLGTILPAFVIAFLSRVLKLHDLLSNILRIRQRFDVEAILLPLAIGSGANLRAGVVRRIRNERDSLMHKTFYKYASSSPGKAIIESHYITMALDQWSWYWIVLEATFLAFITATLFLLTGVLLFSSLLLLGVILMIGLLQVVRHQCENYALQEVEEILNDPRRRTEVAGVFNAL